MVGLCSGTISGLVAATPTSGFIHPWASLILGVVSGTVCNFSTKLKTSMHIDDALDLFATHAIGGTIGLIFNGFFADGDIIALDGFRATSSGGWLVHNWKQLYIQFAYVCATLAYSFVVTAIIAKAIDWVPYLRLRATDEEETLGMDDVEIGEFASDYIEVDRHAHVKPATTSAVDKTTTALHEVPSRRNLIRLNMAKAEEAGDLAKLDFTHVGTWGL